jgi:hypothetical protein
MKDFSQYRKIGSTTNTVVYTIDSDPDILIIVPREGTIDTVEDARENVAYYHSYAHSLGKPCGSVVILANVLSQDVEARRVYQEWDTNLFFAGGLVVENALSRALGSFFIGLSRPNVPTQLFGTIDNAIEWLRTMRPKGDEGEGNA